MKLKKWINDHRAELITTAAGITIGGIAGYLGMDWFLENYKIVPKMDNGSYLGPILYFTSEEAVEALREHYRAGVKLDVSTCISTRLFSTEEALEKIPENLRSGIEKYGAKKIGFILEFFNDPGLE